MHREVYALVGPSGTGKSHRASALALELGTPVIIDDGLLIRGNRVLAGQSAKRERTRIAAVKRAIFYDPEHARIIREKIQGINPDKILVLGTSRRMVQKITACLGLPPPCRYIEITEIASSEAIHKALAIRRRDNRHVIPLPTFAIKKDFPGYLVAPIRAFFHKQNADSPLLENSIVRPIYSTLGNFYIAEQAIIALIDAVALEVPGIVRTGRIQILSKNYSNIAIEVEVYPTPDPGMRNTLLTLQKVLKNKVEYLTGFYLTSVNIIARNFLFSQEKPAAAAEKPAAPSLGYSKLKTPLSRRAPSKTANSSQK